MNASARAASMSRRPRWIRLFGVLAAAASCLMAAGVARADVPGRVGRIAFIEGDVQGYSEADPEWKLAYINQPITSRNSVFVGDGGRAEISVGSTTLAMDAGSQVDIQQLDDNTFNANVVRGRVSMRIRRVDAGDVYNVAAPDGDFALLQPGRYRIDALEAASGIAVFAGQASVQTERSAVLVNAGNAMRLVADPSNAEAPPQVLSAALSPSSLDDWVVAREARFRNGQAERYVSPNMTGYEELDANGRWATEAEVGPVWYPTTHVRNDWAPYRYGRWAYVAPWGYTWIDDAPWGFAPFHYGRWIEVDGRWGWTPGAYVARPAYAPALVGFYGGNGFSASFSVGSGPAVGWYPLAPWQRYSPHYTRDARYISQVNNIAIVNPPRRFGPGEGSRDWNREHGGTMVPRDAFASQRSISRVATAAPRDAFERAAPVNPGELPRPALIPGAVRRGPDVGGGRPEFRNPRDFASRPFERGGRPGQEQPAPAILPSANDRRPSNDARGPAAFEAPRPAVVPGAIGQPERGFQYPRGPNAPGFERERERRPAQAIVPSPEAGPAPAEPRRFTPRPNNDDVLNRGDQGRPSMTLPQQPQQQQQPAFERPSREMRNMQPQGERPAQFERPQRIERPAAPMAPPASAAPAPAPAIMQPRPQAPPVQQAPAPAPAPVAPRAPPGREPGQAPAMIERGQNRESRER